MPWRPICGPKLLFRDLVPEGAIEPELHRRFTGIKSGSGTFRMNVALSELPDFTLPARASSRRTITARASSSARRSTTWTAPISMRARTAGRGSRWSRC